MRDPKRIKRILEKIETLWNLYPNQRLAQLIENYILPSGDERCADSSALRFYTEDDVIEKELDKILKTFEYAEKGGRK